MQTAMCWSPCHTSKSVRPSPPSRSVKITNVLQVLSGLELKNFSEPIRDLKHSSDDYDSDSDLENEEDDTNNRLGFSSHPGGAERPVEKSEIRSLKGKALKSVASLLKSTHSRTKPSVGDSTSASTYVDCNGASTSRNVIPSYGQSGSGSAKTHFDSDLRDEKGSMKAESKFSGDLEDDEDEFEDRALKGLPHPDFTEALPSYSSVDNNEFLPEYAGCDPSLDPEEEVAAIGQWSDKPLSGKIIHIPDIAFITYVLQTHVATLLTTSQISGLSNVPVYWSHRVFALWREE